MLMMVANPCAGAGRGKDVAGQIAQWLEAKKIPFTCCFTERAGHAMELAREAVRQGVERLLVIGGDGTFHEAVNGLEGYGGTLALCPAGTGNDFAGSLNLPEDMEKRIETLIYGAGHPVDLLKVNQWRVLNVFGMGLDVDLLENNDRVRKIIKGAGGYYVGLVDTLLKLKFRRMTVTLDDQPPMEDDYLLVAAANGSRFGGGMPVAPGARIDDGLMDVCLIRRVPRIKVPSLLIRFLKGQHPAYTRYVSYCRARTMTIEAAPQLTNMDGELKEGPPLKISVLAGALRVVTGK